MSFLLQPDAHDSYPLKKDPGKKELAGGYYNFKGNRLPFPEAPGLKRMIVLTRSSNEEVIHQMILAHMVIDLPSQEVIDSMKAAYKRANDSKGLEQKFLVGEKGKISMIVQGTKLEVPPGENLKAGLDLKTKGDTITAYDVHTHGELLPEDEEPYFRSGPSSTDRENAYFNYRHQASIILSYERERSDAGTGNVFTLGSDNSKDKNKYKYVQKIVFYHSIAKPVTMDFDVFLDIAEKIRNN
jgi:hypothetical protein